MARGSGTTRTPRRSSRTACSSPPACQPRSVRAPGGGWRHRERGRPHVWRPGRRLPRVRRSRRIRAAVRLVQPAGLPLAGAGSDPGLVRDQPDRGRVGHRAGAAHNRRAPHAVRQLGAGRPATGGHPNPARRHERGTAGRHHRCRRDVLGHRLAAGCGQRPLHRRLGRQRHLQRQHRNGHRRGRQAVRATHAHRPGDRGSG